METSDAFSLRDAGDEATPARPRRMSMDEDMFYRELMTSRPAEPPSYDSAMRAATAAQRRAARAAATAGPGDQAPRDVLPPYTCAVHAEGAFMRKMEIEETTKRAEYRNWQQVYVELRGTALNVYQVKKERGWWSAKHDGPDIAPDNPPWVRKSTLEKSYSLLHADAGIAADYKKCVPSVLSADDVESRGRGSERRGGPDCVQGCLG
jgi:Pleckstrin homology domain